MRHVLAWVAATVCAVGLAAGAKAQTSGGGKSWWPFGKSNAPQAARPMPSAPLHYAGSRQVGVVPRPSHPAPAAGPSLWDKMTGFVGSFFKPKPQPTPVTIPNTSIHRNR
jgi:hypothetical protein